MKRWIPAFFAIGLPLVVFWQFFIKGYIPMPGSFMAAWYEPWKSDSAVYGVPTIPHKPVGDDIFRQIIPFKLLATDILRTGELPLWNPFGGGGQPLFANLHPGYLNPFSLLLFINKKIGWALYIIVQLPLLFLATYWYGSVIGLSMEATTVSTAVFSLSGAVTTRLIYGDYVYALITLPLLLGVVEKARQGARRIVIVTLPAIVAFLLVSVQPQISVYILITSFVYALVRLWKKVKVRWLIGLSIIGIGVAGIQVVPTLVLLKDANVTAYSSAFIFKKFLMPLSHLLTIVIPNYFGNSGTYNFWGKTDYVETVVSVGTIPVFLALTSICFIKKETQLIRFFGWGMLVTILLTLDWILPQRLYGLTLPLLSTSIPTRLYLLTTFFIAVLCGFGIDALIRLSNREEKSLHRLLIIFICFLLFVVVFTLFQKIVHAGCTGPVGINCWMVTLRNTMVEIITFGIFVLVLFFKKQKAIVAGLILIVGLGVYNAWKFLPMSDQTYFMTDHPLFAFLRSERPVTRVHSLGTAAIATDFSSYYGFLDPNYYDPLYLRRYGELVSYGNTGDTKGGLARSDVEISRDIHLSPEKEFLRNRLYSLLRIGAFIYPKADVPKGSWVLWQDEHRAVIANPVDVPRSYFVSIYEVISDNSALLQRLFDPSFNPTSEVILEEDPGIVRADRTSNLSKSRIVEMKDTPSSATYLTMSKKVQLLVLADTYDSGWRAYIDGKETKIYRANYTFRAVVVPEGKHVITFLYQPDSVKLGILMSAASLLVWSSWILLSKK